MALTAQLAEFFQGSRVEEYTPLFALVARLMAPELLGPALPGPPGSTPSSGAERAVDGVGSGEEGEDEDQEFLAPSLPRESLRLVRAIVVGHTKVRISVIAFLAGIAVSGRAW